MTDNEVIKALECCIGNTNCGECPMFRTPNCMNRVFGYVFDLINRQKAEIEELRKGFTADADYFASEYDKNIKSEAIKEFAEMLKIKVDDGEIYDTTDDYIMTIDHIDNLVKKMTEVSE